MLLGLLLACLWGHLQCSGLHSPIDPDDARVHCVPCATELPIHLSDVDGEVKPGGRKVGVRQSEGS